MQEVPTGAAAATASYAQVDMLQLCTSDKLMIAATYGCGLFSADAITSPAVLFT